MRARRSLVAVSVAALAALSLAACGRSAPDVAAYVGDTRYSVERVDAIYDDAQRQYADAVRNQAPQTPSPEELRSPVTRQDVLNLLVALDLGKRVAAEKGLQVTDEVSPEQLQQPLRMPATTEYTSTRPSPQPP
ncbi:SurA N-terminal domain-containing protein [Micromonospora chalcea]